jgi:hypothetical protein
MPPGVAASAITATPRRCSSSSPSKDRAFLDQQLEALADGAATKHELQRQLFLPERAGKSGNLNHAVAGAVTWWDQRFPVLAGARYPQSALPAHGHACKDRLRSWLGAALVRSGTSMLTARMPKLPPRSLVITDQDPDLTLATMHNVLVAHWRGPGDARNAQRQEKALRELAKHNPIGFVCLVEPTAAPPDKVQRVLVTKLLCELPVQAVVTVVRGSALRRSFATVVLTGMMFLINQELSSRTSICANERAAAAWVYSHLAFAPPERELAGALEYLQV